MDDRFFNGSGYGSGSGDGYGSGSGYGSGYGSGSGSGSGYGYGSGDGDGSGYGYGYGSGDGDGSGYGYGYGSGDGDGYGYDPGDGDGDGYGYGSGDGDGYGYDPGEKTYWLAAISSYASRWSDEQRARLAQLHKDGAVMAYWKSDAKGRASNGGNNKPVSIGTVEEVAGPLKICTKRALHATFIPPKWKGERTWIVALIGETHTEDDKVAALKREIIGEA